MTSRHHSDMSVIRKIFTFFYNETFVCTFRISFLYMMYNDYYHDHWTIFRIYNMENEDNL